MLNLLTLGNRWEREGYPELNLAQKFYCNKLDLHDAKGAFDLCKDISFVF